MVRVKHSRTRWWGRVLLSSSSALLIASSALAEERDPAGAQALFDQARQLSKAGRHAEACPKFQESNRLDPGIGTQFHLADCYERTGRIASAWAMYLEVASLARAANQGEREKAAQKRADKLEARLPRLEIVVPDASKIEGLEIRRDGILMGEAQWGTPVPVDPGEHELVVKAPGRQTLTQTLRLEEGKTASFELPVLADAAKPASHQKLVPRTQDDVAAPEPVAEPAPPEPQPMAPPAESRGPSPLVIGLFGAGVVGAGVGTAFALMATSTNDDSKKECRTDNPNLCSQAGLDLRDKARSQGNVATVGFIAGGVALAGAATVWLLESGKSESPSASSVRVRASAAVLPHEAAFNVSGSF